MVSRVGPSTQTVRRRVKRDCHRPHRLGAFRCRVHDSDFGSIGSWRDAPLQYGATARQPPPRPAPRAEAGTVGRTTPRPSASTRRTAVEVCRTAAAGGRINRQAEHHRCLTRLLNGAHLHRSAAQSSGTYSFTLIVATSFFATLGPTGLVPRRSYTIIGVPWRDGLVQRERRRTRYIVDP